MKIHFLRDILIRIHQQFTHPKSRNPSVTHQVIYVNQVLTTVNKRVVFRKLKKNYIDTNHWLILKAKYFQNIPLALLKTINSKFTKFNLFCLYFAFSVFVQAQQADNIYIQSQFVVSHLLSDNYKINMGFSSRFLFVRDKGKDIQNTFLELSHFSSFLIGSKSHLGFGVLYRYAEDFENNHPNEFRLFQQFHTATKPHAVRFGHWFRLEERFVMSEIYTRFRYRTGIDFPLQGKDLNVSEFYSLFNTEFLLQLNNLQPPKIDFRVLGGMGVLVTPSLKLETTIQCRLENLTKNLKNHWFIFLRGYIML